MDAIVVMLLFVGGGVGVLVLLGTIVRRWLDPHGGPQYPFAWGRWPAENKKTKWLRKVR